MSHKIFSLLLLFLLTISFRLPVGAESIVIHPYDWLVKGFFAEYEATLGLYWRLVFPNDTKARFLEPNATLRWTVMDRMDTFVLLNITLIVNGTALPPISRYVAYNRTILLEVDINSREAHFEGQPIGIIPFWAEPFGDPGEEIVLSSPPSDEITGEVSYVTTTDILGNETKIYGVKVLQLDPFALKTFSFDWHTGMALYLTIFGPEEIKPGARVTYTFVNGTTYNITRYASTKLGEILGLGGEFTIILRETGTINIEEENDVNMEEQNDMGIRIYHPYILIPIVAILVTALALYKRKKKRAGRQPSVNAT